MRKIFGADLLRPAANAPEVTVNTLRSSAISASSSAVSALKAAKRRARRGKGDAFTRYPDEVLTQAEITRKRVTLTCVPRGTLLGQ
ncbi:MAG: hypothetical protein WBO10_13180 [Pyrinomonadaceae bacterium]